MEVEPLNDKIGRLKSPPKRLRLACGPRGLLLGGDEPKAERRNATGQKVGLYADYISLGARYVGPWRELVPTQFYHLKVYGSYMNYQKMLKEILKSSGWTQEQLAAKLGVSFATVNSWLNGRTKPQKCLTEDVRRLYLAQDVTREPEPVYVTLLDIAGVDVGDYVMLSKDPGNESDDEAIMAKKVDVLTEEILDEQAIAVANSVETVIRGTRSAGRIYDKFETRARAQVVFRVHNSAIARVVSWR